MYNLRIRLSLSARTSNRRRIQDFPEGSANTKGEGRQPIFTGRNEVVAKVIFLHVSVIHSVHREGGGLPQCMLGYLPRTRQTPPQTRQTPLGPGRPPPDQAPPPPEADFSIRSTSGRYASYLNAFLFGQIFPENCMKMKEIGPGGAFLALLGSADGNPNFNFSEWKATCLDQN